MKIALSIPGYPSIDSNLPVPTGGLAPTGQSVIFTIVIFLVLAIFFFALWSIMKGGLGLILSVGHKEALEKNRNRVLYTFLGFLMLLVSFLLIRAFGALLGGNDLLCVVFKPLSECH